MKKIQSPVISWSLSVSGYNLHMPRAVVHGPLDLGGMNWEDLSVQVTYESTTLFLKHYKLHDSVGELMAINLDIAQLLAGTSTPLLESECEIEYLENCWIKKVHRHLVTNSLKIVVWKTWTPKHQQEGDRHLMDIFSQKPFTTRQLVMINQ